MWCRRIVKIYGQSAEWYETSGRERYIKYLEFILVIF